jgi:hypothetical protein
VKTLIQSLVISVVTTALVTGVAGVAQAQPGHHHHHHHPWHPPVVVYHPRPPIVYNVIPSNPAPLADIQLVNPGENRVTLTYRLNGVVRSLPAGCSVQINRMSVIRFDRGAGAGWARYSLTDGVYKFQPSQAGYWTLVRASETTADSVADADLPANPVAAQ